MNRPQAAPVSEKYGTINTYDNGLQPGDVVFPVEFVASEANKGKTCVSLEEDRSNPVFVGEGSVDWFTT